MARFSIDANGTVQPEQHSYPTLPLAKLQKLETLSLYYNLPEAAIICTKCGFALSPKRASEHPGKKHGIAKSARHGLKPLLSSLNLPDPDSLAPRSDGSRPHPYLTVQVASSCRHCGLRSASEKVLADHLKAKHRDKLELATGKQARQHRLRDHIQQGVLFQSWTFNNTRRSWLVAADGHFGGRSVPSSLLLQASPDPVKQLAQKLFAEEHARLENQHSGHQRLPTGEKPTSSALQTNWMRRTGWETILKDARHDILVSLAELPECRTNRPKPLGVLGGEVIYSLARDERRLVSMVAALDRLLDQCGETVRGTDVCLRRWLRGRFPDRPFKAPFELVTKPSSEKVYRKELKRFVCFWLRLFRLLPVVTREVIGRRLNKHQFRALRELWVDDIWRSEEPVDADIGDGKGEEQNGEEDEDDSEDESEDEDEDEDEDDEDEGNNEYKGEQQDENKDSGQRSVAADTDDQFDAETTCTWSSDGQEHHPQDPATDILLRFCYFAITEDFEDGVASSTMLVFFSAVRGLSTPDGDEYLQPHRFTPILARLIYCSRLIFLEAVLPRFSRSYCGIARRPRQGLLRRLNADRREYMCDGTLSPMGEFLSLLSYGNALRRSQGSTFRFHWSDDGEVLSWDGNQQLSMSNFRGLAHEVLRSATSFCSRLMYDWEPEHGDLSQIRDRLSMTTPGYSFVSDPANKLMDAHLELLLRACISPIDGLLRARGKDQSTWDIRAARSYLEAHDDFLKVLMVLCNIDGGQCARISELLTLECFNTSSRERGVCIWGAKMFSIIRHHKA